MKKPLNKLASILDGNRHSSIFVSLLSILLSLICASIILLILGHKITSFEFTDIGCCCHN